jgi:hypothetical protein
MFKTILILLVLFSSIYLYGKPFEVIFQNEDHLIVKFVLPEFIFKKSSHKGENYVRIISDFASSNMDVGYPQVPFYSGIVGLPIEGDITLQVIEKKQEIIKNVNVYPVEQLVQNGDLIEYKFIKNSKVYKSKTLYPNDLVRRGNKAFIGDRFFSSFIINPFQYKARTNELIVTREALIRINISGNKSESTDWFRSSNFIDKEGDSFFLNNEYSKKWRKTREELKTYPIRTGSSVSEIQIIVDEEGIYKISYEHLLNSLEEYSEEYELEFELAFVWDDLDPRYLNLSDEYGSIPIHFVGESDGSFEPGDYFEFFGKPHYGDTSYYDDFTSENVYKLTLLETLGARMAVENGGLGITDPSEYTIPQSFQQTVHIEEQQIMDHLGAQFLYNSPNYYREDIWFWDRISAPDLEIFPFDIQYPHQSNIRFFTAKVCLFSTTFNPDNYYQINHHAIVRVNSSIINNHEWYGQTEIIFENQGIIPNSYLSHGSNNLYISLPGISYVANEQVLLDYMELTYWREYITDNNILQFCKPQNKPFGLFQFVLENFSQEEIYVYKIGSSIMENIQIEDSAGESPYKVTFQDDIQSGDIEYYAVTGNCKKNPVEIRPDIPSNLKDPSNSAEYVIITIPEFIEAEGTLLFEQIWEEQGYSVEIVSLQDIFDEFNSGIRSVESIKDFLYYAYNNWTEPHISHVMLLGDGIFDERDFSVSRRYNLIPFKKLWVDVRGALASDNWIACIVGDDPVADISLGRINVWEEDQLLDVANKTSHYIQTPNYNDLWHSSVTLAAGGNPSEGSFFAEQSEQIRNSKIPSDFKVNRVYCNTGELPEEYYGNTTSLISNINDGTLYLQFIGHGGGHVWADYNLLNKADIATFNNDNYPFVSSLSCYGSAFNYPQSSCLGEELILTPEKGAIGHVGFTGYGYENADLVFGNYLNEAIFSGNIKTLGEIVDYTKARFYGDYGTGAVGIALTHGCALLGDPMINLTLPQDRKQVVLNKYNFTEGDTLIISSEVGPDIERGKFIIFNENDAQLPLNEYYPFEIPVVNSFLTSYDFIIPENPEPIYSRFVKVFAYGDTMEITGMTNFTVGKAAVVNLEIEPELPMENDTIYISADFFDEDGIDHIVCCIDYEDDIPMLNIENNTYTLETPIMPHLTGQSISFHFVIVDINADSTISSTYEILIAGPDLFVQSLELTSYNNLPAVKFFIQNLGLVSSESCFVRLYDIYEEQILLNEIPFEPLDIFETRFEYLHIPLLNSNVKFRIYVNEGGESFSESDYDNNFLDSETFSINMFEAGVQEIVVSSLDGNLCCEFPPNLLNTTSIFYINSTDYPEPMNQPDVEKICLANGEFSTAYQIGTLNESLLADTLGHFPNNNQIYMTFYFNQNDSLQYELRDSQEYKVYRWEEDFQKWVFEGGEINIENNTVSFYSSRIGTFTILQNNDVISPLIDANVEGQEFTHGGYISKNGIISFLLSDANGIDTFNNEVLLWINGENVDPLDYTISLSLGQLTHVPVKYQLSLEKGEYNLTLECTDVNGNYNFRDIPFKVSDEFNIINIGNYPNPVVSLTSNPDNAGRTRFTYVLTDDADDVCLRVYTVNGRLVKTFKNISSSIGYHEYPRTVLGWDCRDEKGFYLANGVYFYRITAKKGNKKIEKTMKMAILK